MRLILLFVLLPLASFGQFQNANWYFGNGLKMDFTGGDPVLGTGAQSASTMRQPAGISDESGNTICYTDGASVYNAAGNVIQNGTFSPVGTENLFVPDPASPDRFYLFMSTTSGLRWSIVDMTLDGGNGGINPDEKDVALDDALCHLACAHHATDNAWWLIAADNNNGITDDVTIKSYSITSSGVTLSSTWSQWFLFGGWNSALDDMRLSPDCSIIGLVFKGHYLVMTRYDNEIGEVYDAFSQAVDLGNAFTVVDQIEFSANSTHLWSLGDTNGLSRYELDEWSTTAISASQEVLIPATWNGGGAITDIKLGPDGKLYIHNNQEDEIDRIPNPEDPIADVFIEDAFLSVPDGLTSYFPNTPNVTCMAPMLDLLIQHQYECLGDLTELWYVFPLEQDSVAWDFGDPASGADNFSTLDEPIHIFSATGTFNVTLTTWLGGFETSYSHEVNIYPEPLVNLGPDEELCQGSTLTLDAGNAGADYDWSTGASTQTIGVTAAGTYWVNVAYGTCERSDTIVVTVIPQVFIALDDEIVVCDGQPVEINAVITGADNPVWSTGQQGQLITVDESGSYSVTASNTCFTNTQTVDVTFVYLPDLLPEEGTYCQGDTLWLEPSNTQGSWEWSTGQDGGALEVTESGTYTIDYEYLGCERSEEVVFDFIEYVPLEDILMPNIFTPNGDEDNAIFRPFLPYDRQQDLCDLSVLEVDLRVYNRWGGLLADDICGWNGKTEGNDVVDGTYYYLVDLTSRCQDQGGQRTIEGHLTLIRK